MRNECFCDKVLKVAIYALDDNTFPSVYRRRGGVLTIRK